MWLHPGRRAIAVHRVCAPFLPVFVAILLRLTFAGAIYITFVCLLPEFLILKYNVPFYFGGTSLLIIVVVTMDFMAQVQNYLMSQQYESLLKKANFKMAPGG